MRRYLGIILIVVIVMAVLIALSAAGSMEFDRPAETEGAPVRSTYNSGPTGTRAFYQLLEESAVPVERWREKFDSLEAQAAGAALILIGPFQLDQWLSAREARQLQEWVAAGGRALIVSRFPRAQFRDDFIHSKYKPEIPGTDIPADQADRIVAADGQFLHAQPTELLRGVPEVALSHFASRMKFYAEVAESPPRPASAESEGGAVGTPPAASPSPSASAESAEEEIESPGALAAAVVHLGDADGAVLADFRYGRGRVVFLSDPFVIANNGISRGANLRLALNLALSLAAGEDSAPRRILFDEYHHGYRRESNPLIDYFRGTPMPWLLLQGALLGVLMLYTYGRRFARPLPLPRVDRHSPLEFVGSMANLQQAAEARDLAIENIYPRFKTQLCRRLGLSSRAQVSEILECLHSRRIEIQEEELRQVLTISESSLIGAPIDDARLIQAVRTMRRILAATRR
ncbi:MAG: DUF4350 domain-containing protein [Blastocatellia bacterium]